MQIQEHYARLSKADRSKLRKSLRKDAPVVVMKLWQIIEPDINTLEFHSAKVQEQLWNACFPDMEFDNARFQRWSSDLRKRIEDFAIIASLQKRRKEDRDRSPLIEIGSKEDGFYCFEKQPYGNKTSSDYIYISNLQNQNMYLRRLRKHGPSETLNLDMLELSLHKGYLLQSLKYRIQRLMTAKAYRPVLGTSLEWMNQREKRMEEDAYLFYGNDETLVSVEDRLGNVLLSLYNLFKLGPSKEGLGLFDHIWTKYKEIKNSLHIEEVLFLMSSFQNFLVLCIAAQSQLMDKDLQRCKCFFLEVYEERMRKGLLLVDGVFQKSDFKNIVTLYIDLGHAKKIKWLLKQYEHDLEESDRVWLSAFAAARLEIAEGDHKRALERLDAIKIPNKAINDRLNAQILQIICTIELAKWTRAIEVIEACQKLLRLDKTLAQDKKNLYQFRLKLFLKLISLLKYAQKRYPNRQTLQNKLKVLSQELENEKADHDKPWLKKKIHDATCKHISDSRPPS